MKQCKRSYYVYYAFLVFLMVLVSACGGSELQKALVGKWAEEGASITYEFLSNGQVEGFIVDGSPQESTYTWIDDTTIEIEFDEEKLGYPLLISFKVEIVDENQLVLISGGREFVLYRVTD